MSTTKEEACCTCASLLSAIPPPYDEKTEKIVSHDRRLDCCSRVICGKCLAENSRFASYCPFCQISSEPSTLPSCLRDPPVYSPPPPSLPTHATLSGLEEPPPYTSVSTLEKTFEKAHHVQPAEDVLHFLDPTIDTIPSLSLRYGVPQSALRKANELYANHLLAARRTILIPGEFYKGGISLSPKPVEGEEEEIRKGKVRRWMVACKVADMHLRIRYDVALLYLKQANYDLDIAVKNYLADEKWEREHPMKVTIKGTKSQSIIKRRLDFSQY